ncbi:hypothetical protein A2635_03835 [Candidatus Peribacteria bacterium RIFCSPHIGHO2_01_FULL_51_9]|nr:MAG: hypothetical protein A2635_03835 [Candidatus Peribacteria bacterium RIFCSPHIGHO2_01_FULL_51_9]
MATSLSITELRNIDTVDLLREADSQRVLVAQLHLGLGVGKEKDTARYRREKKYLARMLGVISEKESLKPPSGRRTVHSPASKS